MSEYLPMKAWHRLFRVVGWLGCILIAAVVLAIMSNAEPYKAGQLLVYGLLTCLGWMLVWTLIYKAALYVVHGHTRVR